MTEAPLVSKALRLVSLGLIVSTVALVAVTAYSGFQEFNSLAGSFSSSSSSTGSNSSHFSEQFNGSTLVISGLNVPNNMSFPLDFQLSGIVGLAGTTIGNFATPVEHIMPGQTMPISVSVALNYAKALSNQSALTSLLFNSSLLTFETKVTANIVPVLGLNVSSSSNTQIPAILGNFNVSPGSPSCTIQNCSLPIGISWNNPSPISFNGGLKVAVTQIPGVSGPLPSASVPFNVASNSPGNETVTLVFSSSEIASFSHPQQIDLGITFSAFGTIVTIPESVTIP
jgi:hypothetical protein